MYIAAHCRASSPPLPWTPIGSVVGFLELLFCHRRCCSGASITGKRRRCRRRTTVEAVTALLPPPLEVATGPAAGTLVFLVCRLDGMQQLCKTFPVMMVGTGSVSRSAGSLVDMMPEKDDDGRFASGGWNSEDGRLSCGYSSFRGKMEDFYDSLKKHLFDNLMKHPFFFTDAKLATSETYQGTNSQFLYSEEDIYWDDSSNVEDYRTIISKAGKAIALCEDHKPNRSDERKRN
ncbi:hypothetical protein Ahy_A07g036841 [Arachis hypogaea]|uniref:Uncharacterized protein n=1 Tax=Arachis hypogaea TaxID=3818 RepID=A0A445CH31_ARAHY|nr:hypothetical protein Ahy_A07g036841 [Arachis hypogaea]